MSGQPKPIFYIICIFYFVIILVSCKSVEKSLNKGEYIDAVEIATQKLRKNPSDIETLQFLEVAYKKAVDQQLKQIDQFKLSSNASNWDKITLAYKQLNSLAAKIESCHVCSERIKTQSYTHEIENAQLAGDEARYQEATILLSDKDRVNARKAYNLLEKVPDNFKNTKLMKEEAFQLGTFRVVVEQVLVTSQAYQLSNVYFQERINEYLKENKRLNKFVAFYTPAEAEAEKLRPDHVITLQFDDFVVGQTLIDRHTESVSKDSVKVGETKVRDKVTPVYQTVSAKFTSNKKTVVSGGILNLNVTDFATNKLVQNKKFDGQFTWKHEWGQFTGDERALTPAQKKLCSVKEVAPPLPNQLFTEFSKPLYNQTTSYLKTYYSKF